MEELAGKTAFVTGAGRGLGRAYAVKLAQVGADVVAIDACRPILTAAYEMASVADLEETRRLIEAEGRRARAIQVDVCDLAGLEEAAATTVAEFGSIDIVVTNAGVVSTAPTPELTAEQFDELLDINLSGTWRTVRATVPHMIAAGRGGAIIMTGATAGFKGMPGMPHYGAAKYGMVGFCKSLALDLGPHFIRANIIHPTSVDTPLLQSWLDTSNPAAERDSPLKELNVLPRPWFDPADAAEIVAWLASDHATSITGLNMPCGQRF